LRDGSGAAAAREASWRASAHLTPS
jgi:hypothetical protein